jgi:2-C-methyl-D-erythritol 4-phosphate cytidylyltransferase
VQRIGIVVAAGRGARFGRPKQFERIGDERLVDRAVRIVGRFCDGVVVVLPPGVGWDGPPVLAAVAGGATRSESVRAGLAVVGPDAEIVLVHDAARPLAGDAVFRAVLAGLDHADGAVPGVPVGDTIKRVQGSRVVATLPRDELVAVQTPQAFRAAALRAAHAAGADGTDDAALVEANGGTVVVVAGDPTNFKVTGPDDLERAARLLDARSER